MTLTTAEVADLLGVTERRVRQIAATGALVPIGTEWRRRRGRAPLVFRLDEVAEYEHRTRRDGGEVARLAQLWREGA